MADSNDTSNKDRASESTEYDVGYEEPDYGPAGKPPPPRTQRIPKRPSLPDGERSLERFIETAKAEPHKHDVSYFDPNSREEAMRKEIDELRSRLAAAESRATKSLQDLEAARAPAPPVESLAPVKSRWGSVALAFVVGGAAMFAINALSPRNKDVSAPQVETARGIAADPIRPTAEPIQEPPKPPPEPVAPEPDKPTAVVDKPKPAGKIANTTPKRPRDLKSDPKPVDPKPADPKPTDPKPVDGLYNPFGTSP